MVRHNQVVRCSTPYYTKIIKGKDNAFKYAKVCQANAKQKTYIKGIDLGNDVYKIELYHFYLWEE